ncbi:oxygen-insensitive NAD(P)H nitroreductase [Thiomicrorhabdus indica]|uniref:oxygen-insensitive NAD(P)H nitroreductase n=1 Tax=Thiomicrorhabdus indica TaxID=2267253 RepID=UPI002AA74FE5|nr:oxygen-insensitive NAD(P)H nitroreductase [Thiomicrorhabdus indica]
MDILDAAKQRYATKKFDVNKAFSDKQIQQVKDLLRLSPSSINSQPWHFIVATTQQGKQRIAKSAQAPYNANEPKILEAAMVVVFCAKTDISDEYLQHITNQEAEEGRFPKIEGKDVAMKVRRFYADLHRNDELELVNWTQKQVYLNVGNLLLGAGALGIDAVPIEGVDFDVLNQEFGLAEKKVTATVVVALGYRSDDDFNANLPKSRLPAGEIFTDI